MCFSEHAFISEAFLTLYKHKHINMYTHTHSEAAHMYVYAKSICFISTHGNNTLTGQISQRAQV